MAINNDIFQNTVKRTVGYAYAHDATVSTPEATYSVKALLNLIHDAQKDRLNVSSNSIGKASSTTT